MCNCIPKKGISEIVTMAQKYVEVIKEPVIVYEYNEKFDFSVESWFYVHKNNGAKAKVKINTDGTATKIL